MLRYEFIFLQSIFFGYDLSAVDPLELLECLYRESEEYMKILKDTETGSNWATKRRREAAESFRELVWVELKYREHEGGNGE